VEPVDFEDAVWLGTRDVDFASSNFDRCGRFSFRNAPVVEFASTIV